MNNEELKNKCFQSIIELLDKYKNDEYMLQRIHNHIINYLPNTLEYEKNAHEKRKNRANFLSNEQQIFTQVFLSKNLYYYLSSINLFYEYDGITYNIIKEDDIIHKLLSTISRDRVLLDWKQKTKMNIIKQIKERSLFTSIPETDTIQNVLKMLYPTIFHTKNYTKYFLTIIGGNILKKNNQLIFLINSNFKKMLVDLDSISLNSIGINNISTNFITKYHENHPYENCRLIKINDNNSHNLWTDMIKKNGLNLLCVAVYYSKRYENSDNYIDNILDDELKLYTNYIKYNTSTDIVNTFLIKYIETNNDNDLFLEWKNLYFIWKQFLSDNNYPTMIYVNTLKNLIKEKYKYDEINDGFYGITSKHLPLQKDFIKFWNSTITCTNVKNDFENELEIDEICYLFKLWVKQTTDTASSGCISEETAIKIISHFYSDIEIIGK